MRVGGSRRAQSVEEGVLWRRRETDEIFFCAASLAIDCEVYQLLKPRPEHTVQETSAA
jgi:hypothetical protein